MLCVSSSSAQKAKSKAASVGKARSAIFAVIDNGTTIEPIAVVDNGKLVAGAEGAGPENSDLAKTFYKAGSRYNVIFGGVPNGTVTIAKSNVGTECGGSSANVSVESTRAKLTGFVMGLATNMASKNKASGLRRMPAPGEKLEIEALVRAEYAKNKVAASAYKQLHYYNLTAVDVDNDGIPEMIGSYWIAPRKEQRDLLFFVAEKGASGKYSFTHSDYTAVTPKDLMSGDPKDLDTMGGELLLDLFDYDSDGVSEIFTVVKAFEGNNYHVYKRQNREWTKIFETYDYRCAY
jgi:hypothetical protein